MHRRARVGRTAWIVIDQQRFAAECLNASMGGAAVRSDAPATTGSFVRFELSPDDDGGVVSIQCEVVRAGAGELGLRFTALDRASLEAILSLL